MTYKTIVKHVKTVNKSYQILGNLTMYEAFEVMDEFVDCKNRKQLAVRMFEVFEFPEDWDSDKVLGLFTA